MNNSLRVCLVCDNFFPTYDGVVNVVNNYHKFFLKHAHSLLVVPKIGTKKQSNLKNIHYVPSTKLFRGWVTPYPYSDNKLKLVLQKFKPNIIHIHSPFILGKYFIKYAKKHEIPCVMTYHTQYYLDFKNILKSTVLSKIAIKSVSSLTNKIDYLFTISTPMINKMKQYGIKKKILGVLPNATDLKTLKRHKYDDEINKKFNIDKDKFVIVFVGRIIKYKNLDLIIKVASELKKITNNFVILICGDGSDLKWMKNKSKQLNVDDVFNFIGSVSDRLLMAKIYSRANLNIMFSSFDILPLTIIEAASQYTPTIGIKKYTPGHDMKQKFIGQSVMLDNSNGYLSSKIPKVLSKKIYTIMKDEKNYEKICKNAHQKLYITWDYVCNYANKVYKDIILHKNHNKM